MSGFASKWMLYAAALQAGWTVPAMVAWAVSLGTVFLGAKATSAVFLGPTTKATEFAHESSPSMVWGMGFMAAGSVILGIAPQLAVNYLLNPIVCALGLAPVQVTWLGLSADAGSFSTVGGLTLAVVSLVVGGVIYAIAYVSRPATAGGAALAGGGIFTGGEPLSDQGRLTAGDFSSIFLDSWKEFFRWSNVDAVYLGVWSGLQWTSGVLGCVVGWMERQALWLVVVLAAVILAAVRFFAPAVVPGVMLPEPSVPMLLVAAIFVAAIALLATALASSASRKLIPQLCFPLMLLIGIATVAGLQIGDAHMRLGLLEVAALITIGLVWQTARTKATKLTYLAVVLISAGSLVASELLMDRGQADWSRALLVTSVCVKLAAVPMFFWLLSLADEVPALVLGLIIAVVDMAAFGELYVTAQSSPELFAPQSLWMFAAAFTSLFAAILMLTQKSLKRLLVLSTVEDAGFLLMGLASFKALGVQGAIIAASVHAVAKALLFICLSAPEADGALEGTPTALAVRYPVSAFGFLFGMLAMLGLPPTLGFIGRWRLYETALQIGLCPLAIFIFSSILALIAYVLALTRFWWGPPVDEAPPARKEPLVLKFVIVSLVALLLVGGIWPNSVQMLMGVAQ
jgi:formate hydrogenlyase subunit 3/multisubunit Na+/H+ antiporter MnhD subunit